MLCYCLPWLYLLPCLPCHHCSTHNWGTESDPEFKGYHNGNSEPRGFGEGRCAVGGGSSGTAGVAHSQVPAMNCCLVVLIARRSARRGGEGQWHRWWGS